MGLQSISKKMRHAICKDLMYDIDMVNAHPTLLLYYCNKNGIECEQLKKYVNNREEMLRDLLQCLEVDRDGAKKDLLAIINGRKSGTEVLKKSPRIVQIVC